MEKINTSLNLNRYIDFIYAEKVIEKKIFEIIKIINNDILKNNKTDNHILTVILEGKIIYSKDCIYINKYELNNSREFYNIPALALFLEKEEIIKLLKNKKEYKKLSQELLSEINKKQVSINECIDLFDFKENVHDKIIAYKNVNENTISKEDFYILLNKKNVQLQESIKKENMLEIENNLANTAGLLIYYKANKK